jgi:glycosyltransferase involved in cell wall biosynthesis
MAKIKDIIRHKFYNKNILMVSSLKKYKGIDIFVSLARKCPEYSFVLILSSAIDNIKKYFSCIDLPNNLQLLPQQNNLIHYYADSSIVLNLTIPNLCIESFGMTLLEGFYLGTPCIAPAFGGPKEIVVDGKNGFLVNPEDETAVIRAVNTIMQSEIYYAEFAENALQSIKQFSIDNSINKIIDEVKS